MKKSGFAVAIVIAALGCSMPVTQCNAWEYSERKDEMTGKITRSASVMSSTTLDFPFPYNGGAVADLWLQDSPRRGKLAVIRVSKGQFLCYMSAIRIKFDSSAPVMFGGSGANDGSTDHIFIDDFPRFLASVKKAQTVLIGATFFQSGEKVMRFDVSNLIWK